MQISPIIFILQEINESPFFKKILCGITYRWIDHKYSQKNLQMFSFFSCWPLFNQLLLGNYKCEKNFWNKKYSLFNVLRELRMPSFFLTLKYMQNKPKI